jgi:hypothetical protein
MSNRTKEVAIAQEGETKILTLERMNRYQGRPMNEVVPPKFVNDSFSDVVKVDLQGILYVQS